MKILTVVGARPQFIKAAAVSRVLRKEHREILVHTGQHYDSAMSDIFFAELGLPEPDINLHIGSGHHGAQTGAMLAAIENALLDHTPDAVLVYGDTNSTLAGALAASKLRIPVAHVEAGLRSFNRAMPEEINRILTDHLSAWLFTPSEAAGKNLANEGITNGVHMVGDIMLDSVNLFRERASALSTFPGCLELEKEGYYLCTIHRAENTDNDLNLQNIFMGLNQLPKPVVLPLHPRTRKALEHSGVRTGNNIIILDPVGYLDMLQLEQNAACILTDSGGIQKEAYFVGVPCVTLRTETEWVETVNAGWNLIAGTSPEKITTAVSNFSGGLPEHPPLYGEGNAAQLIALILQKTGR